MSETRIAKNGTNSEQDLTTANRHDADGLHRMALAHFHRNDLDRAFEFAEMALHAAPARADLWECAGLLAALRRQYKAAESFYHHAIALAGDTATLHRNLGDCLRQLGRLREAIVHYERSLQIDPELQHANRALAMINTELGNTDAALEFWLRAWRLRPAALKDDLDQIAAILNTGCVGSLDHTVEQITTHHADDPAALKAVAYVLNTSKRFESALAVARRALHLDPNNAVLCHNVAWALKQLGRAAESRSYSEQAALGLPFEPKIQLYFAEVLLCLGEFEYGWKAYKSGYSIPEFKAGLSWPNFQLWNGEPVLGRQFLLVWEQGLGDQIQCLRFADWLHQRGAIVDVFVERSVAELATRMPSVRAAYSTMPTGPYDYWSHMFRMPEYMNLDLRMLPVAMPYIAAEPEKVCQWRNWLDDMSSRQMTEGNRRVGIVWAGNPDHAMDCFRSIQINAFEALFSLSGITWYSVQKGARERESEALEQQFNVHTLGPLIQGFGDTLAILQSLDLLITVDSSVAHLAGAAGLPVWTLIPAYTDWRWMTERTDSPWYPSMRLFRQRELREWAPVFAEVREALTDWIGVEATEPHALT
jgi:tetratricopeptide (TPR) repeat protein